MIIDQEMDRYIDITYMIFYLILLESQPNKIFKLYQLTQSNFPHIFSNIISTVISHIATFGNINVVEGGVLPPPSDSDKLSLLGRSFRMIICIKTKK